MAHPSVLTPEVLLLVGIAGFVLNAVVLTGGFIWKLTRVEAELRAAIARNHETTRELIDGHEQKAAEANDRLRRDIGESLQALRQRIADVEIWGRDNYVRREDFHGSLAQIKDQIAEVGDFLKEWLLRLERKLDARMGD
jgi:phytoene dehydrogenase-like protein